MQTNLQVRESMTITKLFIYKHVIGSLVVEWLNVSVHGVSFFLMFTDVMLNSMTLPIRLVLVVFFTLISYMLLAFIIYAQ
jgi:hypothetical protein